MSMRFLIIHFVLLAALSGSAIYADTGRSAPILMPGTSCAEGAGLADISVMRWARPGFILQNPALTATLKGLALDFTYMPWLFDTGYMMGQLGINLSGISAGFSLASFGSSDFEYVLMDGTVSPDRLSMSETLFGFSLAAGVLSGPSFSLAAGSAVKYLSSTIHEFDGHGVLFDLGLAGTLAGPFAESTLTCGASLLNLGKRLSYINEGSRLPLRLRAGAALSFPFFRAGHRLSPMLEYVLDSESRLGLGVEYSFNSFVFIRSGYVLFGRAEIVSRFTAGLGLKVKNFFINYGLRPLHDNGASLLHALSLGLELE